jgi:(E)-4-hydroxy-3-methylbut-2-enyl-diphosphate synthase
MTVSQIPQIKRRLSRKIWVGSVAVGGDAPISVQSMINTDTCDIAASIAQINALAAVGADIVRVSVPTMDAARAFAKIKQAVQTPLVADIHFDYKIALAVADCGADCLRINPGNIGSRVRIREVINAARTNNIPIRIGVNAGSLEKDIASEYKYTTDALVASAMRHVDYLVAEDFHNFKLSIKASDVFTAIAAYRAIATQIEQPLHLGITESGSLVTGSVKSSIGLGTLLMQGIGDTLRVSLAADPLQEIKVGYDILKSLHLRSRGIECIACPSCARQNFDVIEVVKQIEANLADIVDPVKISIIGCVVNGPGEAKSTDVAVVGGNPDHLIYIAGKPVGKVASAKLVEHVTSLIKERFS